MSGLRNPALREISSRLDGVRVHARQTAGGLGPDQINWQPERKSWSVGQCLEHLIITQERYEPVIPGLIARARGTASRTYEPWKTTLVGRFIKRSVTPGSRPVPTGRVFAPSPQARPDVLNVFLRKTDELERWLEDSDGLDLGRIKLASPMSRLVRYHLGEAFDIVTLHCERHLQQADRVKARPDFPSA
jgi:hypothetical protein